jgi:hypothetical protein
MDKDMSDDFKRFLEIYGEELGTSPFLMPYLFFHHSILGKTLEYMYRDSNINEGPVDLKDHQETDKLYNIIYYYWMEDIAGEKLSIHKFCEWVTSQSISGIKSIVTLNKLAE